MNINRVILGLLIAMGYAGTAMAQYCNTASDTNTACGTNALISDTTGSNNSAFGAGALAADTSGLSNTAIGLLALSMNTTGNSNTASGTYALEHNTTGTSNTANGHSALVSNITGNNNTASGYQALDSNTGGSNNIGIGYQSGFFSRKGSNNVEIGNIGLTADNNVIRIGTQGTQRFTQIAGISGVNVTGGAAVLVNARGQLGVASSSIRYKDNVNPMGDASDKVLALRPVTFQYKEAEEDGSKPIQYGLIAEEVEKVMPDLVVYNDQGQPETVAYQTLAPLLLNELQKEHAQIERMQAEIDELRKTH